MVLPTLLDQRMELEISTTEGLTTLSPPPVVSLVLPIMVQLLKVFEEPLMRSPAPPDLTPGVSRSRPAEMKRSVMRQPEAVTYRTESEFRPLMKAGLRAGLAASSRSMSPLRTVGAEVLPCSPPPVGKPPIRLICLERVKAGPSPERSLM